MNLIKVDTHETFVCVAYFAAFLLDLLTQLLHVFSIARSKECVRDLFNKRWRAELLLLHLDRTSVSSRQLSLCGLTHLLYNLVIGVEKFFNEECNRFAKQKRKNHVVS